MCLHKSVICTLDKAGNMVLANKAETTVLVHRPKTFIVISSEDMEMPKQLLGFLIDNMNEIYNGWSDGPMRQEFNRNNWQNMWCHHSGEIDKKTIIESAIEGINKDKNFMMMLSGYENNAEWNDALVEFISTNNVAATFLSFGGEMPPEETLKFFHGHKDLGHNDETAIINSYETIRNARDQTTAKINKDGLHATLAARQERPH
jgi:hypothetical protein